MKRLQVQTIDFFLLHNPEYVLSYFEKEGFSKDDAHSRYMLQIVAVFDYLETEVSAGRIKYYGISSNTLGYANTHMFLQI